VNDYASDPVLDIGHGVTVELRRIDGVLAGVYYEHPCANAMVSPGWIPVKTSAGCMLTGWDVVSEAPLTLSPSVLCRTCGHHGYIRDGRWVSA
jgi:hypothetical protein